MALLTLELTNFRCFGHEVLELEEGANFFTGLNGSGKTSILEAIYLLAHGRSFRVNDRRVLCKYGSDTFASRGMITTASSQLDVQVRYCGGALNLTLAGTKARGFAEVAGYMPVRIIDAYAHLLIEGSPAERRRFIDWGVFHVEHEFVSCWRVFQRLLRQRNAALKARCPDSEIHAWDAEFSRHADLISFHRATYLRNCLPFFREATSHLLGKQLDIRFRPGWAGESMAVALRENYGRDRAREMTSAGPHRANIELIVDDRPASDALSRGQQKMLASALILGQIHYAASLGVRAHTLLVDDPAAELDVDNLGKLAAYISQTPAQLVIAGVAEPSIMDQVSVRRFHVEQGHIRAVV